MKLVERLQPRNYTSAARVLAVLALVAAGVTIAFAAVQPGNPTGGTIAITVGLGLLVGLAGLRVLRLHDIHPIYWALAPFLAIGLIVIFDFLTADGSVSAQIFFCFPVLYAASQLRRAGALVITGCSIAGLAVTVLLQLPVREAVTDLGYVGAAMATAAGLLIVSGERQDALVLRLEGAAAVDSLTGLVTRRVLDEAAQAALGRSVTNEGIGLILLDVDNFKSINDVYGHPAGDEVLVRIASMLVAACRPSDVASRLGGDEIAVLIVGCTAEVLEGRAGSILDRIRSHRFEFDGHPPITITVSMGIAHTVSAPGDFRSLYGAADKALYEAKRLGRNRVAFAPVSEDVKHTG